jgi:hypothetical protein
MFCHITKALLTINYFLAIFMCSVMHEDKGVLKMVGPQCNIEGHLFQEHLALRPIPNTKCSSISIIIIIIIIIYYYYYYFPRYLVNTYHHSYVVSIIYLAIGPGAHNYSTINSKCKPNELWATRQILDFYGPQAQILKCKPTLNNYPILTC